MKRTSLPVVVTARHVRLSAAHLEILFGAGHDLVDICALPPTGTYATGSVVGVRGPAGTLAAVRVVGPLVRQTAVRLSARDAAATGIERATGCTVEGPRGTVVLSAGVVVGLRAVALDADLARDDGAEPALVDGGVAAVVVHGERERELRDLPVSIVAHGGWVELDADDANALEIGPSSTATLAR